MLKKKSTGTSPLLNGGQPKLEQIAISDVEDLVQQMAAANAQAVAELNKRKTYEGPDKCRSGCSCGPCRDGHCGACEVDRMKATTYDRWGDYRGGIEPPFSRNYYRRTSIPDRFRVDDDQERLLVAFEERRIAFEIEMARMQYEAPRFVKLHVDIDDPEPWK